MKMFCFSYLCGEYNPQTEVTMANVEFSGRIAWLWYGHPQGGCSCDSTNGECYLFLCLNLNHYLIYKQNALLLVVGRKILTYENTSFIRHAWSA